MPDVATALAEMRRVLVPSGCLLFVEHGEAPDFSVRRWQNRLTPFWKQVAGGCHLNRPVSQLLERGGFAVTQLENVYVEGPRPFTYMYEGRAVPRPSGG